MVLYALFRYKKILQRTSSLIYSRCLIVLASIYEFPIPQPAQNTWITSCNLITITRWRSNMTTAVFHVTCTRHITCRYPPKIGRSTKSWHAASSARHPSWNVVWNRSTTFSQAGGVRFLLVPHLCQSEPQLFHPHLEGDSWSVGVEPIHVPLNIRLIWHQVVEQ